MPVSFSAIAAETATVLVALAGGTLNITYLPNEITESLISKMQENTATAGDFLVKVIKSWDLYQDDAQTQLYPIDAASLSNLGVPTLEVIIDAIVQDIRPNSQTAKTQS